MKKIFFISLFSLLSIIILKGATFATFFVDGIGYSINRDSTGAIVEASSYKDINHNYDNLDKTIIIPDSVVYQGKKIPVVRIGNYAFYYSRIDSVVLPNTVTYISEYAFSNTSLKYIDFGEGCQWITEKAFYPANALTQLRFPASLQAIFGANAFAFITVKDIYCAATTPPSLGYYVFYQYGDMEEKLSKINLHVPYGCGSAYKNAGHWGYFNIVEDYNPATSTEEIFDIHQKSKLFILEGKMYIQINESEIYDLIGNRVK